MVFSSLIFLFVFLPLVLLCHFACPARWRNIVLLVFSFAFYAWGEPRAFFVMLAVILVNWCLALAIERCRAMPRLCTGFLLVALCASFGFLFYFKYLDFASHCVQYVLRLFGIHSPRFTDIVLPIGISFYVFQSVSYTIDVWRGECSPQRNIAKLALYISFFPQLIAGPIVKYHEIEAQLTSRHITLEGFAGGLRRFIFGLAKKTLIANSVATVADSVFGNFMSATSASLWVGALAYSLQIYFDFSGYSDMALGLARMFGFHFEENFNYPYVSRSVAEFWRRWHISLGSWFREYLFYPVFREWNGSIGKRLRKSGHKQAAKNVPLVMSLAVVWFVTGLWHGAAFVFIAYGLYHGFFIILETLTKEKSDKVKKLLHINEEAVWFKVFATLRTFAIVYFSYLLFRSPGIRSALNYFAKMFTLSPKGSLEIYSLAYFATGWDAFVMALAAVLCLPVWPSIKRHLSAAAQSEGSHLALRIAVNVFCLALLLLCATTLASGTYNPFIYFRF